MAISNFPAALLPIIQTGYLERRFEAGLRGRLAFRAAADRETFSARVGETITRTKPSLMAVSTAPMNPTVSAQTPTGSITNLDNGLVNTPWSVEQYSISLNQYGGTTSLNTVGDAVGIANQFVHNAFALGEAAARTMEYLVRDQVMRSYLSGNTRVTVASTSTSVNVDDVRGFLTVPGATNAFIPVSNSNPLAVLINGNGYLVTAAVADATNVSTAYQGLSGVLTLTTAVSAADGAAGKPVVSGIAPSIIRPNAKATVAALTASDTLTMAALLDAKARLELNAVPKIDGCYEVILDAQSARQLFADSDFKQLFQGATAENAAYKAGELSDTFLGLRFRQTTEAALIGHPTTPGLTVHHPVIMGEGAVIEGDFAGQNAHDTDTPAQDISVVDGVTMVTRAPLDRLGQNVAQSWYAIAGWCCPTDLTANSAIIGTASNAAYKRAVVLQHVG